MKNKRYYKVIHEWPDPDMQDDDLEFPVHWSWRVVKYEDPSLFYLPWLWFIWPDQQYSNRDSVRYELQLDNGSSVHSAQSVHSVFAKPWGWSDYFDSVAKEMENLIHINKALMENLIYINKTLKALVDLK